MKVCLAPNGELELWEELDVKKSYAWPAWNIICGNFKGYDVVWSIFGAIETPEFWGREVLGEL